MRRNAVVLGAIALVGAMLGLWLYLRKSDDAAARPSDSSATPTASASSDPAPTARTAPSLPESEGSATAAAGSDEVREYMVGGIKVRDHRAGKQQPVDIPPNIHPPEARQLPSAITHAIGQQVKAVMLDCAASVPREARGPGPRLEGQILVAIKDHKLSVTSATMQLRDVFGAAVEPTKACIEQKSVGLQVDAADQADMETYSINITFAIP